MLKDTVHRGNCTSVFYLSSKEAEYINAQSIIIDGGLIKRGI